MRVRNDRLIAASLTMALSALTGTAAQAAPVAYDGFEAYNVGGLSGQGAPGNGWDAEWTAVAAVTVVDTSVAGELAYSGGAITVNGGDRAVEASNVGGSGIVAATRNFTQQTSGPVYFSLLFQQVSGDPNDFVQFALDDNANPNQSASIGDVDVNATTGNKTGVRIQGDSTGDNVSDSDQTYAAGAMLLLVGKIEMSGTVAGSFDRVSLYLNPTTLTEPGSPTSQATALNTAGFGLSLAELDTFMFRTAGLDNASSTDDVYRFDELRIATDYASVVSSDVLVPEPASLGLVSLAGLIALRRRRA